jgi:H+/Cl- antiporter ClcA
MTTTAPAQPPSIPPDPAQLLKSKSYLALLVMGAIIGVPVSAAAYFFLKVINVTQKWLFTTLPNDLGLHGPPNWWPILPLVVGGLIVGASIVYLPGTSGHRPAEGLKTGGSVQPVELYGIVIAAFATLAFGAVLGPEAPLIAVGSGMGVLAVRLIKRDAPAQAMVVIGAAGSFAAIASLLGSPIVGAFLLMEAAGLGGGLLGIILTPGLLAAGIGSLIFIGLYRWTGYGTFTLAIPNIPPFTTPDAAEFLWAVGIGVAASIIALAIRWVAQFLEPLVERRTLVLTPVAGLAIGACALLFANATGRDTAAVLFSGENTLAPLIQNAETWTVGALVLLMLLKGLAYAISLSCFRGGPTFPGMFIGAAGGIALSHLAGLPLIAGVAMGIGAMSVAMLGLPLTSVLLACLFLQADAVALMPLVIVAVVVAYVASARLGDLLPTPNPKAAFAAPTGSSQ